MLRVLPCFFCCSGVDVLTQGSHVALKQLCSLLVCWGVVFQACRWAGEDVGLESGIANQARVCSREGARFKSFLRSGARVRLSVSFCPLSKGTGVT